jgi:hypothetical protein
MSELKPEYEEAQCSYCKHWYPVPVGHHHGEDECLANQKEDTE